ncbi:MAG: hypothetical protein N2036_00780, partial [Bryobacteraceae bacterium]|nr:hypothetical protein [Bryobacteraceae bacterium]
MLVSLLAAMAVSSVTGQEETREELIQKERRERAAQLRPERVSRWEERIRLLKEKKIPERISYGYNG